MKRRVVLLEVKATGESLVYKSAAELIRERGDIVGVTLGALWNGLSRGNGEYENKRCRVSYHEL